jgi:hypothetical protein
MGAELRFTAGISRENSRCGSFCCDLWGSSVAIAVSGMVAQKPSTTGSARRRSRGVTNGFSYLTPVWRSAAHSSLKGTRPCR